MKKNARHLIIVLCLICGCCLGISTQASAEKKIKSISFKKYNKTLTIERGQKLTLKVTIKPSKATNKTLKWKSSKKKVVSVTQKGVIKGKKKGTAKITAETTDGSDLKITLKVTVGKRVSSLQFVNEESFTELEVGKSHKLKVEVLPADASNKKLEWSTSNSKIATVDSSGNVKGIANGTVTITAKSTDGTNKKIEKRIKVVTYIKSISLSIGESSPYWSVMEGHGVFIMAGKSVTLNANIEPGNASSKKLLWSSGNPDVAIVSGSGVVTVVGKGVAVITAQAADKGGKKKTFYVYGSALDKGDCEFVAHRGRCELAPENSMAAFELAMTSGFDSVEFDIWPTADNEFVVSHNKSLADSCGVDVDVTKVTLAQATSYRIMTGNKLEQYPNEYIPSLRQVLILAQMYPKVKLSIELKKVFTVSQLTKLLTEIDERGFSDRVRFISFRQENLSIIRSLKELGGNTVALEFLVSEPDDKAVNVCKAYHADYGAKYVGITEAQVRAIHNLGLKVNVWTMTDYMDAYHMVHTMKVDRITTNCRFFR